MDLPTYKQPGHTLASLTRPVPAYDELIIVDFKCLPKLKNTLQNQILNRKYALIVF